MTAAADFTSGPVAPVAPQIVSFLQHVLELRDAGGLGDAADRDALLHVADPGEFGGLEARRVVTHQRLERDGVHEGGHHRAVLRRDVVEPVGGGEPARAGHVLHDDVRIARDVPAKMARQHARIDVEAGRGFVADHDVDGLALVEIRNLVGRRRDNGAGHQQQARRNGSFRVPHEGLAFARSCLLVPDYRC